PSSRKPNAHRQTPGLTESRTAWASYLIQTFQGCATFPTQRLSAVASGDRSSAVWQTWRPAPRGQTFERTPSGVCDLDASNLDLRVVALHDLKPYSCQFTADEISYRLKREPEGKQSIHTAATRRNCQDFEHLAMSFGESLVFGLRGHFDSHHGVDGLPARRGGAIAESFASKRHVVNVRLQK